MFPYSALALFPFAVFLFMPTSLAGPPRSAKQLARRRVPRGFTFLTAKYHKLMHGYWRDKSQNLIQVPSSLVARHAVPLVRFGRWYSRDNARGSHPGGQSLDRIKSKSGFIAIEPVERDGRVDRKGFAWADWRAGGDDSNCTLDMYPIWRIPHKLSFSLSISKLHS